MLSGRLIILIYHLYNFSIIEKIQCPESLSQNEARLDPYQDSKSLFQRFNLLSYYCQLI